MSLLTALMGIVELERVKKKNYANSTSENITANIDHEATWVKDHSQWQTGFGTLLLSQNQIVLWRISCHRRKSMLFKMECSNTCREEGIYKPTQGHYLIFN